MPVSSLLKGMSLPELLRPAGVPPGITLWGTEFHSIARRTTDFLAIGVASTPALLAASAKRQTEFLAGRVCARAALAAAGAHNTTIGSTPQGVPIWPSGWCGSISHSHGWAVVALAAQSDWQALGVDVEVLLPLARAQRLASRVLSPEEYAQWSVLPAREQAWWVSLAFCSKESLYKALSPLTGASVSFQDIALLPATEPASLALRLNKTISSQWPGGSLFSGRYCRIGKHLLCLVFLPQAQQQLR